MASPAPDPLIHHEVCHASAYVRVCTYAGIVVLALVFAGMVVYGMREGTAGACAVVPRQPGRRCVVL